MKFSIQSNGTILIEEIVINGAAYRASFQNGLRCSIRKNDEIFEINNSSLLVIDFTIIFFQFLIIPTCF